MYIGQFGDSFWPVVDGVGRVMYSYAETLTQMGHRVTTAAPRYNKELPEDCNFVFLTYRGVPIPRAKPYRMAFPGLDILYRHRMSPMRFDIAHAHSPFMAGMEALRVARKQVIPLVGTFHSKFYDDFLKITGSQTAATMAKKWVVSYFRRCDEVWAVNEGTAQVLRDYGFDGEIIIMPNGVSVRPPDMSAVADAKRQFAIADGPVLLYVGQINWKKNVRLILEACAGLKSEGRKFQLVLAGQGPDEHAIAELVHMLGLAPVTVFAGHVTDYRLLSGLYAWADLFLFPSLYDNAPMVLREAAAMGTPAVLVRGSDAADVIAEGENGFLCENDVDSLKGVIAKALDNPNLREIGRRASETIPVDWPVILRQVIHRYERLIERGPKHKGVLLP